MVTGTLPRITSVCEVLRFPCRNQIYFVIARSLIYVYALGLVFFIIGFVVPPNMPELQRKYSIEVPYSFFSGFSWVGVYLTIVMSSKFYLTKKSKKLLGLWKMLILTIASLIIAIFLYPVISIRWSHLLAREYVCIISAVGMALASWNVFLFGLNDDDVDHDNRKEKIKILPRFLIITITLVSLMSVAVTIVLSGKIGGANERAIIFSSNLLLPIATYTLGYLAKLIEGFTIVKAIGCTLSLIIGFLFGMITTALMEWNIFIYTANITFFLIVGLLLALRKTSELKWLFS